MATCHCGATLYRSLDGEWHCIRCAARTDLCPGCEGRGYRMRGRMMVTCTTCEGTGYRHKTVAPMYGPPSETLMVGSCSGASGHWEDSDFPDAGRSEIGRRHGSDMNRPGE